MRASPTAVSPCILLDSWLCLHVHFSFFPSGSRICILSFHCEAPIQPPPHTEGFLHCPSGLLGMRVALGGTPRWPQTTRAAFSFVVEGNRGDKETSVRCEQTGQIHRRLPRFFSLRFKCGAN